MGQLDCDEGEDARALTRLERAALVARDMKYPAVNAGIQGVLDRVSVDRTLAPERARRARIKTILEKARLS